MSKDPIRRGRKIDGIIGQAMRPVNDRQPAAGRKTEQGASTFLFGLRFEAKSGQHACHK